MFWVNVCQYSVQCTAAVKQVSLRCTVELWHIRYGYRSTLTTYSTERISLQSVQQAKQGLIKLYVKLSSKQRLYSYSCTADRKVSVQQPVGTLYNCKAVLCTSDKKYSVLYSSQEVLRTAASQYSTLYSCKAVLSAGRQTEYLSLTTSLDND